MCSQIPYDNPNVLLYLRIAWICVQLIVIGIYYFTSLKVRSWACCADLALTRRTDQVEERHEQCVLFLRLAGSG
jgi:hypothetical protein